MSVSSRYVLRVLSTCLLLLAACTGTTPPVGPDSLPSTGRTGGVVFFGVLGEPATLDPYSPLASDLTYALVRPVYPTLYRFDPDGTPRPYLAESLEARGKRALVTLADVRWSSGRRVTAEDVVASAGRALPPSAFARLSVRAIAPDLVELRGPVRDWERALATLTWVLPRGRPSRISAGPWALGRATPGLQIVYRQNPHPWPAPPMLERMTVQFIESVEIMLALLEEGSLDAAAVPWAVNLDDRLQALGLEYAARVGWETLVVDVAAAGSSAPRLAEALDLRAVERAFVRDGGRFVKPSGGRGSASGTLPDDVLLGTPGGDELGELVGRALQGQLRREGVEVALADVDIRTFYGSWDDEDRAVDIRRMMLPPDLLSRAQRDGGVLPIARVSSVVAWRHGLAGLDPNPTWDGPLWNAETWAVVP